MLNDHTFGIVANARQDDMRQKLEALLLEGVRSGDASPMTKEDWSEIRQEAMAKIKARRSKKE